MLECFGTKSDFKLTQVRKKSAGQRPAAVERPESKDIALEDESAADQVVGKLNPYQAYNQYGP